MRMFEIELDFQDLSYGSCHSLTSRWSGESSLLVYVSELLFVAQLNRQLKDRGLGLEVRSRWVHG